MVLWQLVISDLEGTEWPEDLSSSPGIRTHSVRTLIGQGSTISVLTLGKLGTSCRAWARHMCVMSPGPIFHL